MTTTKHVLRMTRKVEQIPCPDCPPCNSCLDKPGDLVIQSATADDLAKLIAIEPSIALITDLAGVNDFIANLEIDMLNIKGIPELIERLNYIKTYKDIVIDVVPYMQIVIDDLIDWFAAMDGLAALPEITLPISPCNTLPYYHSNAEFAVKIPGCLADSGLVVWLWEFDDPLINIEDYFEFTPIDMGLLVRAYSIVAAIGVLTITYTYPGLDAPTPITIEFIEGAAASLVLERPIVDDAANVAMWKNPTTNQRFFPDNFNRMYHAPVANATGVAWHWQLEGFAVDVSGFGMSMLISETEPTLNVSVDNTQFLIHTLPTNFSTPKYFNVWYEQCGETSPITTIYFDETGTYPYAVSACGSVHDTNGDIGFTTRTYQWKLDSTSGLYVSLDFIGELFVSDSYPVGRKCTWRFTYTGYPPDTLPPGLVFKKYQFPKLMTGPALALFLDPTPPCATPGIPALGTLTVWLEISGVTGASCELIFTLATPGVTC